jgi:hypothetical protein
MSVYIPNVGEKEALKSILMSQALILGLYKNQIIPDGNTIFETLEELPSGGGRGYAAKPLSNSILEGAPVADKWAVSINSAGKAEAQYGNAAQEWTFLQPDVNDGNTVYGVFGYVLVLPFDAGSQEIKVGDTVTGQSSGASGVVTGIAVMSGTWGTSDAVGFMYLKSKTGAFQNDENLQVGGVTKAVSNSGAGGDAHKRLLFVEALSEAIKIDTLGQKIGYTPKLTMSTS